MSPDKTTLDALRIDRTRASRSGRPVAWFLTLLVLVAVAAALYWWLNRPQPTLVRTLRVQESGGTGGTAGDKTLLNASGYVTARRAATVSSKVTGMVLEVLVEEGMQVELGQVLALDAANVEKSLQRAAAQLELACKAQGETQANLDYAQRELLRVAKLAEQKVASPFELDRAETEAKALQARLDWQKADMGVSQKEVEVWKQQLEDTVIRAPFPGIVTSKDAQPGEMISPVSAGGGFTRTGICTIVDMSSLEIEVDVNESYINRVSANQPVEATLDSYPQWQIPARVVAIIPTADRQKATVKVRVGFDKLDPRILPDMSVKVGFRSAELTAPVPTGITLPREAVQQRDGRDIVWIVHDDRVERRAVTVGSVLAKEVVIAAGLSSGERVVVEGAENLANGASVTEKK